MLTHLPDTGTLQPRCLRPCAGGLAGQARGGALGHGSVGPSKEPGLLSRGLQVPEAKEIQMGSSPPHPALSCGLGSFWRRLSPHFHLDGRQDSRKAPMIFFPHPHWCALLTGSLGL